MDNQLNNNPAPTGPSAQDDLRPAAPIQPPNTPPPASTSGIDEAIRRSNATPEATASPKKSGRKKPIIAAAIVILLAIGGAVGYNVYASQPKNMIAKTMTQSAKKDQSDVRTKVAFKSSDSDWSIGKYAKNIYFDFSVHHANKLLMSKVSMDPAEGSAISGGVELLFDYNDLEKTEQYFKLDLNDAGKQLLLIGGGAAGYTPIVELINQKLVGKWYKIEPDDLGDESPISTDPEDKACMDAFAALNYNELTKIDVGKLYKQNEFLPVEKDEKNADGKRQLKVKLDQTKLEAYVDAVATKNDGLKAVLDKCEFKKAVESDDQKTLNDQFDLYLVIGDGYQVETVKMVPKADAEELGDIEYIETSIPENALQINKPTDATPFKSLVEEFQKVLTEIMSAPVANDDQTDDRPLSFEVELQS